MSKLEELTKKQQNLQDAMDSKLSRLVGLAGNTREALNLKESIKDNSTSIIEVMIELEHIL